MSNELILPSGVDRLSLPQKALALGALGLTLWFVLPVLITLMVNIYMVLALGVPLLFVAYNYQMIWWGFKTVSWKLTQGLIGLDVLSAMNRYLDWVDSQERVLLSSKKDLVTELETISNEISEREKSYQENMKRATAAEQLKNDVQLAITLDNAQVDKDYIKTLSPVKIDAERQVAYLGELVDVFHTKREQLAYNIKAQTSKYKSLKAMSKGMRAASNVMGGANSAHQLWNEANNQLVSQMNNFTANIKTFEDVIKPALESSRFDKQLRETEGRKLLEEFKRTNFQLQAKN